MKKVIAVIILSLILLTIPSKAGIFDKTKKTKLRKGDIISGQIVWDKRLQIDLDPGEWEVVDKVSWSVSSITGTYVAIAQIINGDTVDKLVQIETVSVNGKSPVSILIFFFVAVSPLSVIVTTSLPLVIDTPSTSGSL